MQCTAALSERLSIDSKLRHIFGFLAWHKLPSESTFSPAFAQFTKDDIADIADIADFNFAGFAGWHWLHHDGDIAEYWLEARSTTAAGGGPP